MSLSLITADALTFPRGTNVLIHGVSQRGVMGAGIALKIRQRWPRAYDVYHEAFEKGDLQLGTFTVAITEDDKRVVNLVTQRDIGTDKRQVDYEAVYSGLETLRDLLEEAGKEGRTYSIVMPYIGCGLAGGSRDIIKAMTHHLFDNSSIQTYIAEQP